ncbi:MAG: fructosamine kinase family protein [Ornithinimicrobium sp.]
MPAPVTLPADLVCDLEVTHVRGIPGGSVSEVYRGLSPAGPVLVKTMRDPPPDFYAREAAGLQALRATGSVPVPQVLRYGVSGLVLQWIEPCAGADAISGGPGAERFGRDLAELHAHRGASFGSVDEHPTGYLGSVALDLTPEPTWLASYLQRRVLPMARQAVAHHRLDPAALRLVDRLLEREPDYWGPAEAPSLVHGDLWSGNRVVDTRGRHWLVDPSAHFGHREVDLALMWLFGGFDQATFAAYREVFPLAPGWQPRIALHQLAPLLANTLMHDAAFGDQTMARLTALA